MTQRHALIANLATAFLALPSEPTLRIAIDGVDGAGKTTFADELAAELAPSGRQIIRASVDGFHHPRAARYRQGSSTPRGFFEDSYDYATLVRLLLDPLGPEGSGIFRRAAFDHTTDTPVEAPEERALPDAILLLDGIFLHRPELRGYWDVSIFLDVGFAISIPRCAARGDGSPDSDAPSNRRYVEGQRIYLSTCAPSDLATIVIDNRDLAAPRIIRSSLPSSSPR